jgi:guanine deaminase
VPAFRRSKTLSFAVARRTLGAMHPRARFMERALALAVEHAAAGHGGPFGAVVVADDRIVGEGWNAVVTTNDPTAHAEVQAVRAACRTLGRFTLAGCDVYTSCEPCPMCLGALLWARPRTVYYAATRADAAAAGFDDARFFDDVVCAPEARSLPFVRILPEAAGAPFAAWLAKPDRVPY